MAGKLFNIYSGNTGGVLSTSTAKVGSFGTTSDNFYSVNFDTGRKSIWTNNIEFGRAADWENISDIPSWIESNGVTWANVKDKPAYATRWPSWNEVTSKPDAVGSVTQPVYWDGSTFKVVNSVAPANHDHDKRYVKLDGSNVMSGDLTLHLGNLDRFIVFSYPNTVNPTSNSWRTGVLGTGEGESNFFVVQYQKVNTNSSDWNTAFKIGQDTGTVTFTNNIKVGSNTVYHSGNLPAYPKVNNGALNLQASGTTKVTFYANQSGTSNFNIATGSTNGTISVGGTDVAVKGLGSNAYTSTAYLPLAGGTMDDNAQIKRKGKSGAWIHGRDNALIRETSSTGYHPLFSLKTADGSWELGEYNTPGMYNIPVFSYITDENYNNGNNSATYQIQYPLASGTIALTADLTWSKIADKPSYATRWPSWNEVTSKPAAIGSATQPIYWDGSTFKVANSMATSSHNHDDRYLKLTGGTLSGDLAFSHGSSATDQHITWASGRDYQRLKVRDGQTDVFIFQYSTDSGTTWSDYFTIQNGTAKIGSYTVYHSGNLPAYPTVNNGALNLQANGTTKVTFYANQSGTSNFNIATGSNNGTISVAGTDVAVKGLGSNAYNSTAYLPLAGGKMTGNISWKDATALPEHTSPQYFLVIDAFADGGATKWASKANTLNALTGLTSTPKGTTSKPIYWDGTKFVECLAYSQANVNYANSAGSVEWTGVKNKPSTFAPSAHDHTRILYIDDRDTVETPADVAGKNGIEIHFKNKSKSGITSDGAWTAVIMLDGYSDVSGGYPMELGFSMSDLSDSRPLYLRTPKSSTEWGDWRTILDSKTYTNFTVKKDGTGATGSWNINAATATKLKTARTITINGSSKSFDGTGNISWSLEDLNLPSKEHNHDDRYLKLSGGTLTGVLHLLGAQYADTANTGALDLANSDIYGVNSIKFADLAESAGEGLQWYRDATHVDSLWVKNGVIYFSPNRTWGGSVTDYTVYHSGNLTAATLLGSAAKGNTSKPIYWDGTKFVECLAYSQASVNHANTADTATNLTNNPSLQAGTTDTKKITVTAGGKTSAEFTVPYATESARLYSNTLPENADLNNYTSTGVYGHTSTNTCISFINGPSGRSNGEMRLEVIGCNNNTTYLFQKYWARQGTSWQLYFRSKYGSEADNWTPWAHNIDSSNYTTYTVKKDGTGATGSWNINAATATKLQNKRTITINGSSKSFDGSENISWSLADLNLSSKEHNHDDRYLKLSGGTLSGQLISTGSTDASSWVYGGGTFTNKYVNILLKGDSTYGISGIAFTSSKGNTSINTPSDCAFIQFHPYNPTLTSIGTNTTPGTSGESNKLVIGVNNDSDDMVYLQTPSTIGLKHVVSTNVYTIWDSGNDGSGSGLDADLLDGVHANGLFTNFSNKTVSGNKVLAATIGGKELTVAVEYAGSAGNVAWANITGKPINFKAYSGSLTSGGWKIMQGNNSSPSIAISYNNGAANWNSGTYSATLVYGCSDTRGLIDCAYNTPKVTFGGCSFGGSTDDNPTWYFKLAGTTGTEYNLNSMPYAESAGNAETANSAGDADTLDNFHANGLFQTFTNDSKNNAVKIKIGNTEKSLVVGYATKAGSANSATSAEYTEYLNNYSISNPNSDAIKDSKVKWFHLNSTNSGRVGYAGNNYGFPVSNNANGILYLGTHPGKFGHQLGFSSDGNIYHRYQNGSDFPNTANGGSWEVLLTSNNYTVTTDIRYVKKSGDTMTGLLTTTSGHSHDGIKVGDTYINAINGNLILQNNSAIRFGGDSWDYNVWAGLKYVHSSKTIYLGLADGSSFIANSAQSGGKLYLPGIDNIYTGNGTNLIWHSGNDGNGSGLDADLLDGKHAEDFIYRLRRSNNNVTSQPNNGMIPPAILEFLSAGYPVYTDPEFASGNNSCSVYNNQGNGTVTIERIIDNQGSGNSSGYILKITTNGTASPGAGGFIQAISSRANAIFIQIFRAKVPIGYNVINAENAQGDNATITWLTDRAGTGKWEWYARLVYCGNTGSFSVGGHVYLSGTSNTSVTWYLSHITLVDITKGNYNGLRTRYADHATSSDSASSVDWANITGKATSKTAWGQTFVDSSGNIQTISGNMTSVGQVTPDGNATRSNGTSSANWASVYTRNIISGDHLTLRSGTSKDIIFQTNAGTEHMRLTSGGKLGINSTDPGAIVEIAGKSNTLLGINTSTYLIGHTRKDLHFTLNTGSGSGVNDGYMSAITFGDTKTVSYAGIYVQASGSYGTRIIFGTTNSYANGTYGRVIIDANGKVGIGTMSPSEKLDVGGSIRAFNGTTNWVKMMPESTTWASFYTNSSKYYFDHRVEVNGDIWVYGTNYGITSGGGFYSKGFYHRDYMDNNYVLLSNGGAKKWDTSATANTIVARTSDNFVYAGYYNSNISDENSISVGSVYVRNTSDNFIRRQSIGKFADNLRADEIITITKDLTVTEAWMDTGIIMNTDTFPRGTGTYAIQIASNTAGTDGWYPYFSGILTIYTSTTNGTLPDEVPLHCIGHSNNGDARRIYIRTIEGDGNTNGKIQIAGATTLSAHTYTFKFRKLI